MALARNPFQSILCPVDFSPHSRTALQHAAIVARRSGGRLTALFVSDPLLVAAAAAASYDETALKRTSENELREFVRRALGAQRLDSGEVACQVVKGDPADEIANAVRRLPADLVVMGTQGLSGAGKLFFGSTTERVLRQATVPILTVPPATPRRKIPASWPGKRIVAPVELSPQTANDARATARVADWANADLLLVHVIKPMAAPRWLGSGLAQHQRSQLAAARSRLERVAQELGATRTVDCQILVGDPAEQIAAVASDSRTGLVVVTLRATGGFLGAAQGSTTYRVLGGIGVPVLALPKDWSRLPG
jgi:nucleotide-binding universal stress UspA family protein